MALINTSLPNLIQGVSQQPDALRYDGQCEEQENALSSVVDGLTKRPNTRHIHRLLTEELPENAFVHIIDRSEYEKYIVIIDEGKMQIHNIAPTVLGVIDSQCYIDHGTSYNNTFVTTGASSDFPYLPSTFAKDIVKAITVGDNTFLLNSRQTVSESGTRTPDQAGYGEDSEALLFVKVTAFDKEITLSFEGPLNAAEEVTFTTNSTNPKPSNIVSDMRAAILANTTLMGRFFAGDTSRVTTVGHNNELLLLNLAHGDTNISITDEGGIDNTYIGLVHNEVDAITDLPAYCKNGLKVKVRGDIELSQDDYYVVFEADGGVDYGNGSWVETLGFDVSEGLDADTLPLRLVNTAPDTFELSPLPLKNREAGDDDTNPHPSFINNRINNLFFFKNRLGYLSNDNVIFSEAGEYFNHYRNTVLSLLDSAPIDVAISSTSVTELEQAVGFQEKLIITSDRDQFTLQGADILSPKTISITPATRFRVNTAVAPIPLGSYIYFPFERGNFTGLREYSVNPSTDTYEGNDITEHVPAYIPNNITLMDATDSENVIALVSSDEPNAIYLYKYFFSGSQKVLSSWSKFTTTGNIRGLLFIRSTLNLIVAENGETHAIELPLGSDVKDDAGYTTYLDQRIEDTVLSGNSTITLPYTPADDSVQVYTKDGLKLTATNVGSTVTLAQPVSEDTDVWVGYPYTMKYTFSEQLFKASTGNSKSPSAASKLMVRNGALFFDDTAYFQVKVTPKARQTYVNTFTPDVVGSTTIGELNLDSGFYRFPVFTKAADTTITIENDSALPSNFQSAEFESFVHSRSNRYG